jgi:gamma-glutamyl-gamma-aminobutyrate hydrolase PuuD
MMNDGQTESADDSASRRKALFRKRVLLLVVAATLVGAFLILRVAVRVWMHGRLPANAPRIAFSLDNTLLARTGITDTTYEQAMIRGGGYLVNMRPDMAGSPQVDHRAVEKLLDEMEIDGVFLTGGGDIDPAIYGGETDNTMLVHRLRDDFEIELIRAAADRDLPILGICRGCQVLNVAFGGTLRNLRTDDKLMKTHLTLAGHSVDLEPNSKLAGIFGNRHFDDVISLHGQAVDRPGDGVMIVAKSTDGIAEAIEVRPNGLNAWIIGIQWHPELALTDDVQNEYFDAFIEQAREVRKRRIASKWQIVPYLE